MEWFMKVVKEHYADFSGRARRKEFWMFNLFVIVGVIALEIIAVILGFISSILTTIILIIIGIGILALIIPGLAVGVRRMHDAGKSGWFILIPVYNLILAITEGERGDNQYGPDPKAGEN
jgi:uncharacterized membrane protein YhaH (DUF805 family)